MSDGLLCFPLPLFLSLLLPLSFSLLSLHSAGLKWSYMQVFRGGSHSPRGPFPWDTHTRTYSYARFQHPDSSHPAAMTPLCNGSGSPVKATHMVLNFPELDI